MVDGVYQDIAEALKPGVSENEIVALATKRLYEMGSDCVEAINAISGERCSPHPHNFTDRLIRPGDQAFFDIIQSFIGYRTCYYRTFSVGRATTRPARRLQAGARVDGRRDRAAQARASAPTRSPSVSEGAGHRLRQRDGRVRPQLLPRPRPRPARAAADLRAQLASTTRSSSRPAWCSPSRPTARRRRRSGRADRGGVVLTPDGAKIITLYPAQHLPFRLPTHTDCEQSTCR